MPIKKSVQPEYWEKFCILQSDIEFLYNQLLELEVPQTQDALLDLILNNRIAKLVAEQQKIQADSGGTTYLSKNIMKWVKNYLSPPGNG
jgi:hypothetical protein